MNSTAKRYISGRAVQSDPGQTAPKTAVGIEPSSSTSRANLVARKLPGSARRLGG
jgi:hypothetical protein